MTGHIYKKKRANEADEERVIMHEGDASSTVTESDHGSDQQNSARPPYGRNFRQVLDSFVHSNKFQVFVVSLVIFNCLIVIVELLINLRIFEMGHQKNSASQILRFINIAILGLFVMEMGIKMLAMGLRFFKHRMEMFDFVVILLAFSLGLAFGGKDNSTDGIGLLIILRLWRVTKILNSMIASVKHEAERKMAKERRALRALEREVCKLREYCLQQEYELQMYRVILHQNGIPLPTVLRVPATPRTLNVIAEVNDREERLRLQQQNSVNGGCQLPPPPPPETVGCGTEQVSNGLNEFIEMQMQQTTMEENH